MRRAICKLTFNTAVRFGSDAGGSSLTGTNMAFRADVLFSALFRVLLVQGRSDEFLHATQCGRLTFSDAFPWRDGSFFLPRPVGIFAKPDNTMNTDPSQRKLLKRIAFIPMNQLNGFLEGKANLSELEACNRFGNAFEETRVNQRDGILPMPYRVAGFRFEDGCGLYVVVEGDDAALSLFEHGMTALSGEGIGGKVSSGWGKFGFELEPTSEEWNRAMENSQASRQMLLSSALPSDDEIPDVLEDAYYTVVRRGGFAFSEQINPLKKQTVYLLGAGSTFRHRFRGVVLDVGVDMPHPVWRYARAMFMGVDA